MNAVDRVRALFAEGTVVECVENTYIPQRNGTRRIIRKVGKAVLEAEMDGKPYRMCLPTRVRDVLAVSGDSVTMNLRGPGDSERLEGHTATYRVVSDGG